jgi:hypothetical protein
MARRRKGLNRHQKAIFKAGENRVGGEEIERLIEMAESADPVERLHAAENLCPCHVRKRVEAAWKALYRLMLDPDVRVRRAAWHTLEDGGCPNDPALLPVFEQAFANEADSQARRWVERFAAPALAERDRHDALRAAHSPFQSRGRCSYCGETGRRVRTDYATELAGSDGSTQFALICQQCDGQPV